MVKKTVHETLVENNWDYYRDLYIRGAYSFDNLVELNNIWYHKIQNQEFYNLNKVLNFFSLFDEPVSVVELGCYRGSMAQKVLERNENITLWAGHDICHDALEEHVVKDDRFWPIFLTQQWYEQDHADFDVFVSTHTLEHLTVTEVKMIIDKIEGACQRAVYLELPLIEDGKVWRGGASSHVLRWGRKHFRDIFNGNGWKIIYEPPAKNTVMAGWTMGAVRK